MKLGQIQKITSLLASDALYVKQAGGPTDAQLALSDLIASMFAAWPSYASTITGFSSLSVQDVYYFALGKLNFLSYNIDGTSNAGTLTFTIPNPSISLNNIGLETTTGLCMNNGALDSEEARVYVDPVVNPNLVNVVRLAGTANFTSSGRKIARGLLVYQGA